MNFKKFFITLIAASAALLACTQEEDLGLPRISVTPSEISLGQGEESASLQLTATRDWLVQSAPDWIGLSINEGKASTKAQAISLTANANSGYNRSGEVVFTIGLAKCAVTVNQTGAQGELKKGTGSLDDPYTVTGVIEYVQALGADVTSTSEVYVKGKVAAITEAFSAQYGNGTFTISDDGTTAQVFTCYRILYLGNRKWTASDTQIEVGDEVVVCGKVVNYRGNTPETSQGSAFLYSLNGKTEGGEPTPGTDGTPKGSGTLADPFNPAGAAAYAKSLGSDVQSTSSVYIKGKITKVGTSFEASGTYGNANFNIADVDDGTGDFYIYQTYYLGNRKWVSGDTDVKVDDEVIVCGPVVNYKGNTPETVGKGASFIYSLNGKTEGGEPTPDPDYSNAPAKTVAEFIAAADGSTYYKLSGEVSNFNATYCSFDLTDATGSIYVYSVNNKSEWTGKISNGATVSLAGKYQYYEKNSQHEVIQAYILSAEGGNTNPDPGPGTGGDFASNVTMTAGTSCYDDNVLNVNGENGVANLKFGTSKKYGDGTVVIPAGTKTVTFYSIAWKGADASLKVTAGGKEYTFDVKANDGAAGNAPYNVTVTDSDKYTITLDSALSAAVTAKVETYEGNNKGYRAFIFGVQAQ